MNNLHFLNRLPGHHTIKIKINIKNTILNKQYVQEQNIQVFVCSNTLIKYNFHYISLSLNIYLFFIN